MKSITGTLLTLLLPLSAAEPTMNHETALSSYVEKLNT